MLKISGAILCITGFFGFGFLKIAGWKGDLKHLQQWILLFQKMKSRISYQKETLEESCSQIGNKETVEYGELLKQIGNRARAERQEEFSNIWKEEMELWCRQHLQHNSIKEMLLQFPEYAKGADEELQMYLFAFYLEELNCEKERLENQIREKQKPVMAVSLVFGVMISILLI